MKQPYPDFLDSATLGIMPASLWSNSPIELNNANTNPVGSGPYMIKNVSKESSGVIDSFQLTSFNKFILGEPHIKDLNLYFYSDEDGLINALENGTVDQISSITPLNADILKERNYQIVSSMLPRVFGLFFNQNQNQIFTDKVVTNSIDQVINKDNIVNQVLFGYGIVINNPIPPNIIPYQQLASASSLTRDQILQNVKNNLAKDGWSMGANGFLQKALIGKNKKKTVTPLEFSISTSDAPELAQTASLIQQDLATVGIKVDIKTFEIGNLNQSVIRPRDYDTLLFGEIINHASDLLAFWDSSQRKDPGLNVAMYTNAKVDKLLEDASTNINEQARVKDYIQFETDIQADMPAVFLYSPKFIYVVSPEVKGISIENITSASDRFANVYSWYTETENVWKIFSK